MAWRLYVSLLVSRLSGYNAIAGRLCMSLLVSRLSAYRRHGMASLRIFFSGIYFYHFKMTSH